MRRSLCLTSGLLPLVDCQTPLMPASCRASRSVIVCSVLRQLSAAEPWICNSSTRPPARLGSRCVAGRHGAGDVIAPTWNRARCSEYGSRAGRARPPFRVLRARDERGVRGQERGRRLSPLHAVWRVGDEPRDPAHRHRGRRDRAEGARHAAFSSSALARCARAGALAPCSRACPTDTEKERGHARCATAGLGPLARGTANHQPENYLQTQHTTRPALAHPPVEATSLGTQPASLRCALAFDVFTAPSRRSPAWTAQTRRLPSR